MTKYIVLFLSIVGISSCTEKEAETNFVQFVNPLMGTDSNPDFSHGNVYPVTGVPFGMTHWTPQTGEWGWIYQYSKSKFQGIRATHQPSPWIGDYAQLSFMPQLEVLEFDDEKRSTTFSHQDEESHPYSYKIKLENEIESQVTALSHSSILKFQYPDKDGLLLFDASHAYAELKYDPNTKELTGYNTVNSGGVPDNFAGYFVIKFEGEIVAYGMTNDKNEELEQNEYQGDNVGFYIKLGNSTSVQLKVGTSFISVEQARINLKDEIGDLSFSEIESKSKSLWEAELRKVAISSDDTEQLQTFYSCLYRTLIFPREFHEMDNGKMIHYSPYDGQVHDGPMYVDNGFWDTFRGQFPLISVLDPDRNAEMLQGFVNSYKEGDWLPKWTSPGYRNSMISTHSASLIADAYLKGIDDFDYKIAYEAIVKDAMEVSPFGGVGREGIEEYKNIGYVAADRTHESTARTLEFAYDDFCVGKMAASLGEKESSEYFLNRSFNYQNVFDSTTNFMRGKNSNGDWEEGFNPIRWGGSYTEGSAWHYSWSVLHDPAGLVSLMGGKDAFSAKMDAVFSTPPTFDTGGYGREIHEMTEMVAGNMGQYAHGNQPVHHFVYLYNYINQPWKTQFHTRNILSKLYNSTPAGYCGDEDNGQMSAWYVLSALGFYQVAPGHDQYILTSPLFTKAKINLPNGNTFEIKAPQNSSENVYWNKIQLNGEVLQRTWITYDEIMSGGTLEFDMTNSPEKTIEYELPMSLSDYYTPQPTNHIPSIRPTVSKPKTNLHNTHFTSAQQLVIETDTPNADIYFTTDGSLPSQQSTKYSSEITIDSSQEIRAVAFKDGHYKSPVLNKSFVFVDKGISVELKYPPVERYSGGSPLALVDKKNGPRDFFHSSWMGFHKTDLDVTISFTQPKSISSVNPNFLENQGSWIFFPTEVSVQVSNNGHDFVEVGSFEYGIVENDKGLLIKTMPITFERQTVMDIRLVAKNVGALPTWHPSSGADSYMFIDEILIK